MLRRTFTASIVSLGLVACANRPPRTLKPNSFSRLGFLPANEQAASGDIASFAGTPNPRRNAQAAPIPPLNPMLLGMLIGGAMRAAKDAAYNSLSDAVGAVPISPLSLFSGFLDAEIAARSLQLERVSDPQTAVRLRSDNYTQIPANLDGVLDIQLYNTGYYDLGRGRGYAPYLYIYARVLDLVNPGEVAEDWSYNGTLDKSAEGPRDFLMSPSLIQSDLSSFSNNATVIQAAFTSLLERTAKQLVSDVLSFQSARGGSPARVLPERAQ